MQRHKWFVELLILCSLGLIACGSSAGEPCQVPSDCSSGLLCCKTPGSSAATRGICRSTCSVSDATVDVIIDVNEEPDDAGSDGGPDGSS